MGTFGIELDTADISFAINGGNGMWLVNIPNLDLRQVSISLLDPQSP